MSTFTMQAVSGVPVAPTAAVLAESSWPNILPGPFILLLLLPAFPLILFSIGARPPDTSALPFTTDDLWQTTAFITVAGAVVLSMGLYPGMLSDVTTWVKDGSGSTWRAYLVDVTKTFTTASGAAPSSQRQYPQQGQPALGQNSGSNYQSHRQVPAPPAPPPPPEQVVVRYEHIPGTPNRVEYRPPEYRQDQQGNVVYRPGAKTVIPGTPASKRMILETIRSQPTPHPNPRAHSSLSSRHIQALRNSSLKAYYSPHKPSLFLILFTLFLTIVVLIVLTGKILHATYDSDTSARKTAPSSKGADVDPWHMRELAKRKKESEKETITRNQDQEASFVGRLAKMNKDARDKEVKKRKQGMELLRKELTKRKLPLVALDWDYDGKGKAKRASASGGSRNSSDKATSKEEAKNDKEPGKLKKMLLGPLADGVSRDAGSGGNSLPKEGGPGWKPADDAVAHAAIRGGAARAESMANNLIAQKRS